MFTKLIRFPINNPYTCHSQYNVHVTQIWIEILELPILNLNQTSINYLKIFIKQEKKLKTVLQLASLKGNFYVTNLFYFKVLYCVTEHNVKYFYYVTKHNVKVFYLLFNIPIKVRLRLEKIQRDFISGHGAKKKKLCLVKWSIICRD